MKHLLLIAVNGNGTHTFSTYEWRKDWENPEYRKAWEFSAEKTFRKIPKKNRYPITLNVIEVENE